MSVIVSSNGCSVNRPHVGILRLQCVAYTALLHDSIQSRVGLLSLSLVPDTRRCCGRPGRSPPRSPLCGWPTDRWPARPLEIQRKRSGRGWSGHSRTMEITVHGRGSPVAVLGPCRRVQWGPRRRRAWRRGPGWSSRRRWPPKAAVRQACAPSRPAGKRWWPDEGSGSCARPVPGRS